jgi:hypothetical protein
MSIFEYYRMAIPMFAPSVDLLTDWIMKYRWDMLCCGILTAD